MGINVSKTKDEGVIFYNPLYFSALGVALSENAVDDNIGLNASLCSLYKSGLVDRTQTLNQGFKTCVLDAVPDFSITSDFNYSFEDVCNQRAIEIINLARNEQRAIYLFWSGGIDSTTALVALLNNLNEVDRQQYLTVYLNSESINEYPSFYSNIIKDKLNVRDINDSFDFLYGDHIIVTGELGDQLFGSVAMIDILNFQLDSNCLDILNQPYVSILPKFIQYRLKTNNTDVVHRLFEYIIPLIESCPWEIKSTYDCLWWMNFTLKWQHVDLRFATGFYFKLSELKKNYGLCEHFFNSESFQKWSVCNPDMKIKDSWDSYKFPAKEYIYAYNKDKDYLNNKQKVPSLSMREIQQSQHCFMLHNFTMIKAHETQDIDVFQQKYGDEFNWLFYH